MRLCRRGSGSRLGGGCGVYADERFWAAAVAGCLCGRRVWAAGSWQVRFEVDGAAGHATASVPVPAVPLSILKMQRPLGIMLGMLGLILALGMAGIVAAAVRESRLEPGVQPDPNRRRRALIA